MAHLLSSIDIIAVGEPNELLAPCIEGLQSRLSELVQLRVAQIPGGPARPMRGVPISEEAHRVAATVQAIEQEKGESFPIMLCDHYGDMVTTEEFGSRFLKAHYLCVIVGGIVGLHDALDGRDLQRVSFGRITLSPSLARCVVTDQLYRMMRTADGGVYDLN